MMSNTIPNETNHPSHVPSPGINPHVDKIMKLTTLVELQKELNARRELYFKWAKENDTIATGTQQKFAQIVHLRARELGLTLD